MHRMGRWLGVGVLGALLAFACWHGPAWVPWEEEEDHPTGVAHVLWSPEAVTQSIQANVPVVLEGAPVFHELHGLSQWEPGWIEREIRHLGGVKVQAQPYFLYFNEGRPLQGFLSPGQLRTQAGWTRAPPVPSQATESLHTMTPSSFFARAAHLSQEKRERQRQGHGQTHEHGQAQAYLYFSGDAAQLHSGLWAALDAQSAPYVVRNASTLRMARAIMGAGLSQGEAEQKHINVWMGTEGVRASLHYDTSHNFFFQLQGEKHFVLYPPEAVWHMYLHPAPHPYYRRSQILLGRPDSPERAPLLQGERGGRREVCLQPGQLLYLPPYWFHHVRAASALSLSVNVWSNSHDYWAHEGLLAAPVPVEADWAPPDWACFMAHYAQRLLLHGERSWLLDTLTEAEMEATATWEVLSAFPCGEVESLSSALVEKLSPAQRQRMRLFYGLWLHSRLENSLGLLTRPDHPALLPSLEALRSCSPHRRQALDEEARIARGLAHWERWMSEFRSEGVALIHALTYLESLHALLWPVEQFAPFLQALASLYFCSCSS